jgi:hypothetical protein
MPRDNETAVVVHEGKKCAMPRTIKHPWLTTRGKNAQCREQLNIRGCPRREKMRNAAGQLDSRDFYHEGKKCAMPRALIAFTWGAGAGHPAGDHPAGLMRSPAAPGRGAAAHGGEEAAPYTHRHEDFII